MIYRIMQRNLTKDGVTPEVLIDTATSEKEARWRLLKLQSEASHPRMRGICCFFSCPDLPTTDDDCPF